MSKWDSLENSQLQFFDKEREFAISVHAVPARLCKKQSTANPAEILITALPAFHVSTNRFYNGKCRFDQIGAGEAGSEHRRNPQAEDRKGIFQTLFQAARRARIQVHQLA